MSRREGHIVILEPEPDRPCELCGKIAETRPYGPKGERICFECGQKDAVGTEARMVKMLYGEIDS